MYITSELKKLLERNRTRWYVVLKGALEGGLMDVDLVLVA